MYKNSYFCIIIFLFAFLFTPFAQEVTSSGAFNYTYPIELPPGTNGMAPELALIHISQAGNGMLGIGWSMSGLSIITRDPSYPITFNDNTAHFLPAG